MIFVGIPIPLSLMGTSTLMSGNDLAEIGTWPPLWVNFKAFDTKLRMMDCNIVLAAYTIRSSGIS